MEKKMESKSEREKVFWLKSEENGEFRSNMYKNS